MTFKREPGESWWTYLTKDRPELTWKRHFDEDPFVRLVRSKKTPTALGFGSKLAKTAGFYLAAVDQPLASDYAWATGIALGAASSFGYSAQAVDKAFLTQPTTPRSRPLSFRRKSGFVSMPRKSLKSSARARRGRRKRAQRNRTLARRVAKLEKNRQRKYTTFTGQSLDLQYTVTQAHGTYDTAGWWIYNFSYPGQGDGIEERDGREFRPDSLYIRGDIYVPSSATEWQPAGPFKFRMILVQDMRNAQQVPFTVTSSTTSLMTQFFQNGNDINALYQMSNAENFGRFQVIFDEKVVAQGQPVTSTIGCGILIPFEKMIKKRLRPITFAGAGTGTTYAAVEKGHLCLVAAYDGYSSVSADPVINFTYRWRWSQD